MMQLRFYCFIFLVPFCKGENAESYIAAVVEFAGVSKPQPFNMLTNLEKYLHFIKEAKNSDADIIVFPENGLTGIYNPTEEMTSIIPDPNDKTSPCSEKSRQNIGTKILHELSCAARNNSIYVVVNLAEKSPCSNLTVNCRERGYFIFNTNVVFDRQGQIIARYRKFNLFGESVYDKLEEAPITIFETDFGVKFGTFTCFDIWFERPTLELVRDYGVTDIVYPSSWFAFFPFVSALQYHSAWSYAQDVNLLSASFNYPARGASGSAIYLGHGGAANYTVSDENKSRLLTAVVPKKRPRPEAEKHFYTFPANIQTIRPTCTAADGCINDADELDRLSGDGGLLWRTDKIQNYASDIIESNYNKTLCFESLCCRFNVEYEPVNETVYRAIVFTGVISSLDMATGGIQVCGILACSGKSIDTCTPRIATKGKFKNISIEGTFEGYRATVTPSTMTSDFATIPTKNYRFSEVNFDDKCNASMELISPIDDLALFGIHGRIFTLDGGVPFNV